jgi:dUTPase
VDEKIKSYQTLSSRVDYLFSNSYCCSSDFRPRKSLKTIDAVVSSEEKALPNQAQNYLTRSPEVFLRTLCRKANDSATIQCMNDPHFSLLSGEEIKSRGLVDDGDDRLFRASTYDLSVGDIIPAEGEAYEGARYSLPPGGMVRVVSKEVLQLPHTVTGHVLLKNALCTKGVLAINIGVADPGFRGPISSTLINFGSRDFVVEKGTPFLRVSFHRCPESPLAKNSKKYDRDTYLKEVKQEVRAYSGPTFLNMNATAAQAAETAFGNFKNNLLIWASVAAIVLALLAIFAPLGAANVDKYIAAREKREPRVEQAFEKQIEERYESRLKVLSDQVEELKKILAKQSASKTLRNGKP